MAAGTTRDSWPAVPPAGESNALRCIVIDPLDYEKCLKAAKAEGWRITQILNTHEHRDHTGGNEQMVLLKLRELRNTW